MLRRCASAVVVAGTLFGIASAGFAQGMPRSPLEAFIVGNDRVGYQLVEQLLGDGSPRNIVFSPFSVSLILAALQRGDSSGPIDKELRPLTGWSDAGALCSPARMLLTAFRPPPQVAKTPGGPRAYQPEGKWVANDVVFNNIGAFAPEFVSDGEYCFGTTFTAEGRKVTIADIARRRTTATTLPAVSADSDFIVRSGTHLQTAWRGNTFALSTPFRGTFAVPSGDARPVTMLSSEQAVYPHVRTPRYEAAILPANTADLVVVLPAAGTSIRDVLRELIESPGAMDRSFVPAPGSVTLPPFHLASDGDLASLLRARGVTMPFRDLGRIVDIPGSRFRELRQRAEIEVDRRGIRADAETVGGAIYGGVGGALPAFTLVLDRPFLYMVRDATTGLLLFLGVVADPSENMPPPVPEITMPAVSAEESSSPRRTPFVAPARATCEREICAAKLADVLADRAVFDGVTVETYGYLSPRSYFGPTLSTEPDALALGTRGSPWAQLSWRHGVEVPFGDVPRLVRVKGRFEALASHDFQDAAGRLVVDEITLVNTFLR